MSEEQTQEAKPIPTGLIKAAETVTAAWRQQMGLIDEPEVLTRVPVSRRTWGNWKAKGIVPFIRIGRRCLYHWPSVEAALLRRQTDPL